GLTLQYRLLAKLPGIAHRARDCGWGQGIVKSAVNGNDLTGHGAGCQANGAEVGRDGRVLLGRDIFCQEVCGAYTQPEMLDEGLGVCAIDGIAASVVVKEFVNSAEASVLQERATVASALSYEIVDFAALASDKIEALLQDRSLQADICDV